MIPRGKRKKRVGKERKKERKRRAEGKDKKKIPFCFPFFLTSILLFLQFRYFNPSARFYLEYRTVPVSSLPTVPSIAIGVLVCFSTFWVFIYST